MTPAAIAAFLRTRRVTPTLAFTFDAAGNPSFARTGEARYFDAAGVVQVAATGVLRNAHYVAARRALLLEPARTNLCTRSEEFDLWTSTDTTVTANAINAPNGTLTADLVTATLAFGTRRRTITFTGDGEKSASIFVKAGTALTPFVSINDSTAGVARHRVRITWTGGVPALSTVDGSGTLYQPIALGDGWYWIGFSAVGVVAANTNTLSVWAGGNTTGSLYVWGGQVHDQSIPTSYIPTAAATVARNAETLSVAVPQSWQAMTFYARIPYESGTGFSQGTYFALKPSAASPVISINRNTTGNYRISHNNGSTTVHGAVGSAATLGAVIEIRGIVYADGSVQAGISVNGGAESMGAVSAANAFSGTQPDRVEFGSVLNAPLLFSHFLVANGVRSLAQLRSAAGV